ncbi:Transglutaminase-like protein OS=Leptospira wolbachii serovar Codice str. CDC GN=LEP1GSC195_2677 PE=4 SV=1: Transglut_core: 7TM_transglut [Gemmataceae bacterium]|nr:Transglutaminase-like protein OS=Leptospira wolbachii serovar Codice str. CDC GN=LEP1GSC195_2677 PE=4 SV=1: Transglut_core: 7TM_transglut [Gemmataceae bacterium]VTT98039.1 Transglutaminase-like protein OS=Leptospira wolbachii serovar Codice str. CDC GN=LEP1GSC195_2677 PE=4 SV=1: Transglut_core: 7TM_transglut [Gemmataceae bacterium]
MSRTRLTALTALGLMVVSVAVFVTRRETGGVDAGPVGASVWEVSISVRGELPPEKGAKKTPRLILNSPPDFRRQHVTDVSWKSDELTRPEGRAGARSPQEQSAWRARPGAHPEKGYRLTYTFQVVLGANYPSNAMARRTKQLDAPPPKTDAAGQPGKTLRSTPRVQSGRPEVEALAAEVGGTGGDHLEQYRQFHEYVAALPHLNTPGMTALDCLRDNGGDDVGKSRLLVALCRNRGIPARVVVGIVLNPNAPPVLHRWVEAWVKTERGGEQWVPACPTFGQFGAAKWPPNYLVMRLSDGNVASALAPPRVTLFARQLPTHPQDESRVQAFWRAVSLSSLPPAEQHLAKFLVLLPLATVVVSVFRVLIGTRTYGVFTPALLGLIFRDLRNLPWGLGIFTATVLVGWLFRKLLDRYHLLLIPRTAVMLTLIVLFLLLVLGATARAGVALTGYLALFPIIILTHMVERFWTLEAEDGVRSSFRALLGTVMVSIVVAVALSPEAVGRWVFRYPETLGVVLAVLLLLGRYTGYRLTELYRFQDVIEFKDEPPAAKAEAKALEANGKPAEPAAAPEAQKSMDIK